MKNGLRKIIENNFDVNKQRVLLLVMTMLTVFTIPYILPNMEETYSYDLITLLYTIIIYKLYSYSTKIYKKEDMIFFLLGFILSIIIVISNHFYKYKTVVGLDATYFAIIGIVTIFISSISVCLVKFINIQYEKSLHFKSNKYLETLFNPERKFSKIYLWMLLMFCYLPTLICTYPGIFNDDTLDQLLMMNGGVISAHHPVIHTLFLNLFYKIGVLFGNPTFGFMLSTIAQVSIILIFAVYTLQYLWKTSRNKKLVSITALLFVVLPLNHLIFVNAVKDSLFSILFLFFLIKSYDLYKKSENEVVTKKDIFIYASTSIALMLFRNQVLYVFIATIPFLLVIMKKQCRLFVGVAILSLMINYIIISVIYPLANITPANMREAFSLPIQQIAMVINHNRAIDSESLSVLNDIVPIEKLQNMIPEISDPIKNEIDMSSLSKNMKEFINVWLKTGVDNFGIYVDAFLHLNNPYFYPNQKLPHWGHLLPWDTSENSKAVKLQLKTNLISNSYSDKLREYASIASFQKIPLLSLFMSPGCSFMLMMFTIAYGIRYKLKNMNYIYIFQILFMGTVLIGPVFSIRYAYPMMLTTPIVLFLSLHEYTLCKKQSCIGEEKV